MGISIHAAREGGDVHASAYTGADRISIHAAREGGDQHDVSQLVCDGISIHAAREGGDSSLKFFFVPSHDFNPRRP